MDCPNCKIKMFNAEIYIDPQTIQKVFFCPKCKVDILGEKETGYMEIEDEYYVDIKFESTEINAKKISIVRKLNRSTSILKLKNKLARQKNIRLGAYNRMVAESIYQQALALNLNATIVESNNY